MLRKTVLSLESPTGAFIAALRLQTRNLSGRGPSILLRKTVLSLESPTGAFIAALRLQTRIFLRCKSICGILIMDYYENRKQESLYAAKS